MRIDLHTHSRASDGTDAPGDLVRIAAGSGLDVVALTDHDSADGWAEASEAAAAAGIELVRGMEISTRHQGHGVHLLAYLPDPSYPPLARELDRILEGRETRVPAMLAKLHGLGYEITDDDVRRASDGTAATGRPHVADALVALGAVADRTEAFDTLLGAGRPAYVDRYAAPLTDAIRLVAESGGVSVIAHPWGRTGRRWPGAHELAELVTLGLAGIEVDHQDHDTDQRAELREVARSLDLVVTGSSDYHGTGKTDHDLGCNTTDPEQYHRLLDRAAEAAAGSGRTPPPVLTAPGG